MAILDNVKLALRINSSAFDMELKPLIEACKSDLRIAGVGVVNEKDAGVVQAIILYAKAYFGYNEDCERFRVAYESLRDSLALSSISGSGATT